MKKNVQYDDAVCDRLIEYTVSQIKDAHAKFSSQCAKCPLVGACRSVSVFTTTGDITAEDGSSL